MSFDDLFPKIVVLSKIWIVIATGFGSGFLPKAPGTWGSVVGVVLFLALAQAELSRGAMFGVLVFLTAVGWWATRETEREFGCHDDPRIVIDEICGIFLGLLWFEPQPFILLDVFVCFRFFDILKPGPVGWIDRRYAGAWATMADDLAAGLLAAAVVMGVNLWLMS